MTKKEEERFIKLEERVLQLEKELINALLREIGNKQQQTNVYQQPNWNPLTPNGANYPLSGGGTSNSTGTTTALNTAIGAGNQFCSICGYQNYTSTVHLSTCLRCGNKL